MPMTSDSKNDYQFIRNKMIEILKNEVPENVAEEEKKNDEVDQ